MKFWVISTNQRNLEVALKNKVFGLASKKKKIFERIEKGDQIVFYVGREDYDKLSGKIQKFLCIASVKDKYESDDVLWEKEGEFFPFRLKLTNINEVDIVAPPIVCNFSVVKNPLYWMLPFRSGVTEIQKKDWSLLTQSIGDPKR